MSLTSHRDPIIRVENLTKSYDGLMAVNGLSFDVFENEIFGLLGPNGAGKTTTLEIMETLRPKTGGEVWIDGLSIDRDAARIKRLIGVQLQQSGYYPNLTLTEILTLFADLHGVKVSPKDLLDQVDLGSRARSKYDHLSGGQKQRFSICTTLVHQPKLIFLDEPSTGLDPKARRELWELIFKVRDAGCTVVITTHYMDEAEVLCDRVAIVNEGRRVALDAPSALIDQLVATGYERPVQMRSATLEDVFLSLTGHPLGGPDV